MRLTAAASATQLRAAHSTRSAAPNTARTSASSLRLFSSAAGSSASSSSDTSSAATEKAHVAPDTVADTDPVSESAAAADAAAEALAAAEAAAEEAAAEEAAGAELDLAMERAVNSASIDEQEIAAEDEPAEEEEEDEAAVAAASAAAAARRHRRNALASRAAPRRFSSGALRGALDDIVLSPARLMSPALVGPLLRLRHLLASLRLSFPTRSFSHLSSPLGNPLILAALEFKPEWIEMREEAREIVARILKRVGADSTAPAMRLRNPELHLLLQAMKNFRQGEPIMELLRIVLLQQEVAHNTWMQRRTKELEAAQEGSNPAKKQTPPPVRRPPQIAAACVAQLLELVALHGPFDPTSEEVRLVQGLRTASQLLAAFQSPKMAGQFALDSVVIAEALKEYAGMVDPLRRNADGTLVTDPEVVARQREESLQGLQALRAFYDSIPASLRGSQQHSIMLTAYQRQGLWAEERALTQLLQQQEQQQPAAPKASTAHLEGVTNPRLTAILNELCSPVRALAAARGDFRPWVLSASEQALVDEAAGLWAAAKLHPVRRLNAAWVGNYMRIFRLIGDVTGMMRVMQEALELEKYAHLIKPNTTASAPAPAGAQLGAASATATEGAAAKAPVLQQLAPNPLVLVHAPCYSLLFTTLAQCPDPKQHLTLARAAYATMLSRFEEALTLTAQQATAAARKRGEEAHAKKAGVAAASMRGASFRAQSLLVFDTARASYARFLVRAGASDFMSLWAAAPASEKAGNVSLLTAALNHLAGSGDTARAREVIAEATQGSYPITLTVVVHTAWLGVCVARGDVQEAEAIWTRMMTHGPPTIFGGRGAPVQRAVLADAQAYAQLMLVYLSAAAARGGAGSPERAEMIQRCEAVYASMLDPATQQQHRDAERLALQFSAKEFSKIIRACSVRGLDDQTKLWVQRAQADPATFERLDNPTRAIAQQYASPSVSVSASASN